MPRLSALLALRPIQPDNAAHFRTMGLQLGARFLLAALLGLAAPCAAAEPSAVVLEAQRQPLGLLHGGASWLDTTGQAAIERVAQATELPWQALRPGSIHALQPGRALWVRFTVRGGDASAGERWYLEVPYTAVDSVTLYTLDAFGRWTRSTAGDRLPVSAWPVPHRHPLLPMAAPGGGDRPYFVRIENSHSFSAPIQLVSDRHHSQAEQQRTLLLGLYFGLALLAFLMGALGAAMLRDKAFALYAATVAAMGATQAALTGIGGLHLWPDAPLWNDMSPLVLAVATVGCLYGLIPVLVSVRERSRRLHLALKALGLLALPVIGAIFLLDTALRLALVLPYLLLAIPVLIATLLWAMRRGDRYAGWVLAGNIPVVIGASFPLARAAGWIPASFWTVHAMQVALAIELPVLLLLLMRRSQQRRDYGRRIQGLDRIDPATGLVNAAVFHERLVRLITRSVRLKFRSAVLLVDIVNLDHIRREFNQDAARELPLLVAGRLMAAAREIDSVARLSEHRFGILLEGPLRADEVAEAAPRVVARCLMPYPNRPLGWVPQVRVAQGLIPMDGSDADQLLGRLEVLLAGAASDTRRAVFQLSRISQPAPLTAAS